MATYNERMKNPVNTFNIQHTNIIQDTPQEEEEYAALTQYQADCLPKSDYSLGHLGQKQG